MTETTSSTHGMTIICSSKVPFLVDGLIDYIKAVRPVFLNGRTKLLFADAFRGKFNNRAHGWIGGSLQDNPFTHANDMGKPSSLLTKSNSNMRKQATTTAPKRPLNSDIIHHETPSTSMLVIFLDDECGLVPCSIFTLSANKDIYSVRFKKINEIILHKSSIM